MKIPVNLASQPFRRDRAVIIGSSLLAVIMIGTLIVLLALIRSDERHKRDYQRQLAEAQRQLLTVQREQSGVDRELRQPQNAAVLERSVLLNDILVRKGISWTRVFADLEKVLPGNVRLIQVRPQVDAANKIFLQMVVAADTTAQITAFLEKLESSEVFGATTVYNTIPPSQTDPFFRATVSVRYEQKL